MGRVKDFKLTVDGDPERYIPCSVAGEFKVSGHVTFTLKEDIQVKKLKVTLDGKAKCKWKETSGDQEIKYKSKDKLIEEKLKLIKSEETSPAILTTGEHSIPFTFDVQSRSHLPSSFWEDCGKIKYELNASMERFGIMIDEFDQLPLIIWNPTTADISRNMEPVEFDDEHVDCCLCCASGPVIVHANINKTAMLLDSADVLDVTLTVDNFKTSPLIPQVVIEQTATFRAEGDSKHRTLQVCKVKGAEVGANTRQTRLQLQVGPLDTSLCGTINSTKNIDVLYEVTIKMKGSWFEMSYPIFVGWDESAIPPIQGAEATASVDDPQASADITESSEMPAPIAYGDIHLYDSKPDSG